MCLGLLRIGVDISITVEGMGGGNHPRGDITCTPDYQCGVRLRKQGYQQETDHIRIQNPVEFEYYAATKEIHVARKYKREVEK